MRRAGGMTVQGYNAQAVASPEQIILAADVTQQSNDSGQLEPMITTTIDELERAGITRPLELVLADGGYWNSRQITNLRGRGIQPIVPTKAADRTQPRTLSPRQGPEAKRIEQLLQTPEGAPLYRRRQQIIEPVFANTKYLQRIDRFQRRGLTAYRAEWKLIAAPTTSSSSGAREHQPPSADTPTNLQERLPRRSRHYRRQPLPKTTNCRRRVNAGPPAPVEIWATCASGGLRTLGLSAQSEPGRARWSGWRNGPAAALRAWALDSGDPSPDGHEPPHQRADAPVPRAHARFPARKTLEEFDFAFQASTPKNTVLHLGQLGFLAGKENVILLGPPGTGKTHLSIALGIRACLAGHRVAFKTATEWVALLADAQRHGRLDHELDRLQRIPLLIADEVGYIPFDPQAANLMSCSSHAATNAPA